MSERNAEVLRKAARRIRENWMGYGQYTFGGIDSRASYGSTNSGFDLNSKVALPLLLAQLGRDRITRHFTGFYHPWSNIACKLGYK